MPHRLRIGYEATAIRRVQGLEVTSRREPPPCEQRPVLGATDLGAVRSGVRGNVGLSKGLGVGEGLAVLALDHAPDHEVG